MNKVLEYYKENGDYVTLRKLVTEMKEIVQQQLPEAQKAREIYEAKAMEQAINLARRLVRSLKNLEQNHDNELLPTAYMSYISTDHLLDDGQALIKLLGEIGIHAKIDATGKVPMILVALLPENQHVELVKGSCWYCVHH